MYWFRVDNPLVILVWLVVTGIWCLGGWLLARHAFRLMSGERLLVGFGLGLVVYLWIVNLLGRVVSPTLSFILSAILVLLLGLAFAWKGERPVLDWRDWKIWKWLLVGLVLVWLFQRVAMGMAIFDEPKNLSIVSTMAAGDIPPHHYMNADVYFPYHYGFQLLGSSLVRLGGLFPWSAFDMSKALVGAYFFLLIALFTRRFVDRPWAGLIVAVVMALATGTRFLIYLLPHSWMAAIDPLIKVRAPDPVVGLPLSQAILQGIVIDDGPPAPLLFGFMDGFGWPFTMNIHIGPSTLSAIILLLAWMLASRMTRKASWIILAILFSFWALVWESSYAVFLIGGSLAAIFWLVKKRGKVDSWIKWTTMAMVFSIPFAVWQGGTITELVREMFSGMSQVSSLNPAEAVSLGGFSLRWPLAIYSKHLGALEIFSWRELFVALLEFGPVIFFTPWITWWGWKRLQTGDWMTFMVVVGSWVSFGIPILLSFEYDRDIVRFTEYSRWVWIILLAIMLLEPAAKERRLLRTVGVASLLLMIFGGLVITGPILSAATQTVLTEPDVSGIDALVAEDAWDSLAPDSLVFDPQGWRGTMLTGRLTRVVEGNMSYNYSHSPRWEAILANPSISELLNQGYKYVYIEQAWWNSLSDEAREALSAKCIQVMTEHVDGASGDFRRLINLEGCGF